MWYREAAEKERIAEEALQKAAATAAAADRKVAADVKVSLRLRAAAEAAAKAKAEMEAEDNIKAAESERLKQVTIPTYNSLTVTKERKPHPKNSRK